MKAVLAALLVSALAAPAAFAQAYTPEELGLTSADVQTDDAATFDLEMAFPGGPGRGPGGPGHGPGFPGGPGRGGPGPRPPGPGPRPMPPRPPRPPRPYPNPYPRPAPRPYPGPGLGHYWTCEYRDASNFQYVWTDWDLNQARWNARNECFSRSYYGGCYEFSCY